MFFAGANSIFYGDKLLTTENPQNARDRALLARLGIRVLGAQAGAASNDAVQIDSGSLLPAGASCSPVTGCCG